MSTVTTSRHARLRPAWGLADEVPGWLKEDQARLLFEEARTGPAARVLEIGSHQGRSTILLGRGALSRGGRVTAIDPFVEGRLFGGGDPGSFDATSECRGAAPWTPVEDYSTRVRPLVRGIRPALHRRQARLWTLSDDLRWADTSRSRGPDPRLLLLHRRDARDPARVLPSRDLAYERRSGSMALLPSSARLPTGCGSSPAPVVAAQRGHQVLLRLRLRRARLVATTRRTTRTDPRRTRPRGRRAAGRVRRP